MDRDKAFKVCLDAGHGGNDSGAVGQNEKEKNMNLLLAHLAKMRLECWCEVVMTRYDDVFVTLENRAKIANDEGCDIFVSLHFNGFTEMSAHGAETWYYPGSTLGVRLAGLVQNEIVEATGRRDRGLKSNRGFAVLKLTRMPAILVESGFITNPDDEEYFRCINNMVTLAEAVARAIRFYTIIKEA